MSDWKKKIDEELARKEEEKRVREERERKKLEEEQKQKKQEIERRRLQEHQSLFRCYICGTPSTGPYHVHGQGFVTGDGTQGGGGRYINDSYDWNHPTGLKKCDRCHRWTCDGHFYQGKCQKCWAAEEVQI